MCATLKTRHGVVLTHADMYEAGYSGELGGASIKVDAALDYMWDKGQVPTGANAFVDAFREGCDDAMRGEHRNSVAGCQS